MQSTLLTTKDLAKEWNLTERFLQHDRTHNRTIPFLKINNLVRYKRKDIEAFIESAKIGGGA